ncbi:MAG: hypothetical protein J6Q89_03495, partial [Clostridia bacterium]|nr:hypothetical protein [Clostridia bacterium]
APYAVDLTSDNCEIIRLKKTVEDDAVRYTRYKVEEVVVGKAESKATVSGSDITIEFKVPLSAVNCKVGMKGNGDGAFGYYISAEKGVAKTLYGSSATANINNDTYKTSAMSVTSYVNNGITIDGNLNEEVWGGDFYNATFGNSVVMQRPTWGGSYEYSYKLYTGGNYLYGAVEFDGVANDSTVFTLWLDNGIDEYAWIGDNDASTPHISYKVYPYSEETSKYTGGITISGGDYATVTNGKETVTVNRLQYYTNYKYEFKLGKDESSATPDFYFPTDSNLDKDKVAITKGQNYDYKIQTINGKTYLEFMIDVRNFHWLHEKSDGIEYVTSMTHEVNVNGKETITVYNPAINDRQNFWLTNINSENGSRHDGVGYLYNNKTDFTLPPTRYWSGIKFKPVSGSSTQYEIEEIIYGGESKYDGKELDEIFVYTEADAKAGKLYYFAFTGTLYNEYGKRYIRNLEIHYPSNRYIDMVSIEQGGKLYYINRHVLDGRSARASEARTNLFNWKKGDIVEFGYSGGTSSTTSALNISQLVSHEDLTTTTDIEQTMPGWILYNEPKELPVLDKDEVQILSYEYEDIKEVGGGNNNTGYGADTGYSADTGKGFLNNDTSSNSNKNTMDMNKTVVLYLGNGNNDAKDRSSIIADLGSAKTTNAYTAYLAGGTAGLDPLSTSLEVYGSNDKNNWERITGASYRQILLQKGDGLSLSDEDKATANKPTVSFVSSNGNATAMSKDFGESGPSLSMLSDDDWASEYNGNSDAAGTSNWWWKQSGSKALLVANNQAYKSDANVTFDIIFEYPIERSVNQIDITYFTLVNRLIGTSAKEVKIYTSANGEEWVHAANVDQSGFPRSEFDTAADIYDANHSVYDKHKKVALYNTKGNLGSTVTARYFKLTFQFPDYPDRKVYEKPNATTTNITTMYEWNYIGFTEIDLTHTLDTHAQGKRVPYDVDSYSLTAVAEKPVNYRYLKYTLIETSPSIANCVALDEIEAHYSTALDDLSKKTILHLNTDQNFNTISIDPTKDTYLGRYNTTGPVWQNSGSSMSQPNTNSEYTNQVFAETLLVPGFNYNANADVGFYSNFYIERVNTSPISQPDKPVETPNTNLDWDGRNANVLKKLEHIAPDRVVIDGNLNDTGWDGVWTDADGLKNATNLDGTGTTFKYQLRADGEYLYAAAIIDSAYDATNAPKFGIWLKGNDGIAYYSVGYGETVVDFAKPQSTAEYGAIETLSIATKNGATYDEANEKLTFAYDLVAKKNGENIANSYLFGYTDEIMESTSDGIWVWEGRPQTQSFTIANETAMMSASGSALVTGLNNVGEGKTLVEFKVKLDEFGGKDGFEYFVEATSANGSTIYPYVRTADKHPENNWDSNEAIKVTAEDMTGWGDYRMVEDFAPVTSLGAKVNPSYNGKKTIRFGARYTEEFIRRQNVVDGTDYWMVADVGIIILPTQLLGDEELTLDTSNTAGASAQDIVNWQNVTDEGTNFADYESFVFYVNLVGVEGIESVPLTFRSYVDYYNAENGSDTYYSIPLERSYDGVYNTANENEEGILPN